MDFQKIKKDFEETLAKGGMDYEDVKKLAILVNSAIDPTEPYGTDLHNEYIRLNPSVSIETVAIRWNLETGQMEVFLTWRDETAPAYKNAWHCPGTFMRPGESEKMGFVRLSNNEYGCSIKVVKKVGWDNNPNEERGHCIHHIFLIELLGKSEKGGWFPINALPPKTVEHHRRVVIPMAVKEFEELWAGER